jgi:hypothetical protein
VYLTTLSTSRDLLLNDTRVSSNTGLVRSPSGIFRDDTLYFVWEDYRNEGERDIYGNYRKIGPAPVAGREHGATGTALQVGVYPNPASTAVTIDVNPPHAVDVNVDLFSTSGQRIMHVPLGYISGHSPRTEVDVSTLPSGIYQVVVSAGDERYSSSLAIVR